MELMSVVKLSDTHILTCVGVLNIKPGNDVETSNRNAGLIQRPSAMKESRSTSMTLPRSGAVSPYHNGNGQVPRSA